MDNTPARKAAPIMSVAPFPPAPPAGFVRHEYQRRWEIGRARSAVWQWLCDPSTFTDGQIPPFRVEFLTNAAGETGFAEGVYNAHVGPFMSFSGVLGEIEPERYRDLQYFYGSYAISHALFRPTRLQFWLEDGNARGTTMMQLQLTADVRRRAERVWVKSMDLFWRRFGRWCERDIPNSWLR
ncbi:MAG: hypothetical protein HKN26_14465 [Acidimicrobiales bacterium]|nr:hypothetical protein [Acidimicrobiales bacterium]